MSNLELRIEEEASLNLTLGESSDMSFDAVDFVGVPFAPTVEVEDIEGGHRVSITSMGAEGKKTDEFDVMDGATGATGPQGPAGEDYVITQSDYAAIAQQVESDIQPTIDAAESAASDATAAAAEARAASAATWLSGNVLFGELAESAVLTADDVYAAPPKSVEVFGKSTQAGTPTPDAPVEIKSVDDLTLHVCGKNLLNLGNPTAYSATYTELENGITVVATRNNAWPYLRMHVPIPIAGASYVLSFDATAGYNTSIEQYNSAGTRVTYTANSTTYQTVVTAREGVVSFDVLLYARNSSAGNVGDSCTYTNVQLEVNSTATTYEPYVGTSVSIPLSNHSLRSLPDGTRDTLTLTYQGPSTEHEGWGVFGATLTQNVGSIVKTTATSISDQSTWQRVMTSEISGAKPIKNASPDAANRLISHFTYKYTAYNYGAEGTTNSVCFNFAPNTFATLADAQAWFAENQVEVLYDLATPVTHDLGTVELPILPNPLTAWADGGSAQPTMSMEYEQDINIVIGELRSAIADMATS